MTKTKQIKRVDYNSSVNQDIKGKFVAREVKACFSYEMAAILGASADQSIGKRGELAYPLPTFEEIENYDLPTCQGCGETDKAQPTMDGEKGHCKVCGKITEWQYQGQEIFEWWIVTEYLYRHLKAAGCPVLEWGNNHYWGRCCSGQAIMLDGVISEICSDMEILEGQKYDWSKNS